MYLKKILQLDLKYYEIRETVRQKDLNDTVSVRGWHRFLFLWKQAIEEAFAEVIQNKAEIWEEGKVLHFLAKSKDLPSKLREEINEDFPELSNQLTSSLSLSDYNYESSTPTEQEGGRFIHHIHDLVEGDHDILWGDIIRVLYYSLIEFEWRVQNAHFEQGIEFFYISDSPILKKKKKPETLEDIWIAEAPFNKLVDFLLEERFNGNPLIERIEGGKLKPFPKTTQKFFVGLISACKEAGLIRDLGSGKHFVEVLNKTFNYSFAERYFQRGNLEAMIREGSKNNFYDPFIPLKVTL